MYLLPLASLLVLWATPGDAYLSPAPAAELFSPLIPTKLQTVANAFKSPASFPQYTDRVQGIWNFFSPNTWTSGFLPAQLYLLDTRSKLCPGSSNINFLSLGRSWSVGLVPLEDDHTLDHDVGFLSYPFMQELLV